MITAIHSKNATTVTPPWGDTGTRRLFSPSSRRIPAINDLYALSVSMPLICGQVGEDRYTVIQSLESPFVVINPIPVTIRRVDNGFVASFNKANVNSSGETWEESLINLKYLIVDLFDKLLDQPQDGLGRFVQSQFDTLKLFVRK
jgi:hypothetical protein